MNKWRIVEINPGHKILQKKYWFGLWLTECGKALIFSETELKKIAKMRDEEQAAKKAFKKKITWVSQ